MNTQEVTSVSPPSLMPPPMLGTEPVRMPLALPEYVPPFFTVHPRTGKVRSLQYAVLYFGCDPEFFFERKGSHIIGAEKVLPEGLKMPANVYNTVTQKYEKAFSGFVLDGVQVELNPSPNPCRANLANEMKRHFQALKKKLESMPDIQASFSQVIDLPQDELDSLGEAAKVFGCAPSFNTHNQTASVKVDAATYLKRSAGGHLHFGLNEHKLMMQERVRAVPLLDILVGNTCVLIDRDPGNRVRRENYGRAGEYRLPKHGLEYRTLSNFWLRSYQLMSMVMGLWRLALSILNTTLQNENWRQDVDACGNGHDFTFNPEAELLSLVDMGDIERAINENDLDLARANFAKIRPFLEAFSTGTYGPSFGLSKETLPAFDFFCAKVQEHGLSYFFPQDPLDHWSSIPEGHGTGWENFLAYKIPGFMEKERIQAKAQAGNQVEPPIVAQAMHICHFCGRAQRKAGAHCFCGHNWGTVPGRAALNLAAA